ncbi:ribbon-helix-helix domain-containing protein [Paenarthrobacter nicotinovorans]|uniref:ribbon-helix-helix domain-containing protein n=1 Tax=Paenarthrobacter nicotinovorans TaxID=29320 RepID=UPI003D67B958
MPMPHKGDRRYIPTRLPVADADRLMALADATGDNRGDLIARAVHEYLENIDFDRLARQEKLPMAEAS